MRKSLNLSALNNAAVKFGVDLETIHGKIELVSSDKSAILKIKKYLDDNNIRYRIREIMQQICDILYEHAPSVFYDLKC